jgi:hypothetical protein
MVFKGPTPNLLFERKVFRANLLKPYRTRLDYGVTFLGPAETGEVVKDLKWMGYMDLQGVNSSIRELKNGEAIMVRYVPSVDGGTNGEEADQTEKGS